MTAALVFAALSAGCGPTTPSNSRPEKAEEWYRRAQREFKGADFDEAHDSVSKALAIVPADPEVKILAAEIALTNLDYAEVLQLLKGVPGTPAAALRGRALWYKGDLDAAADDLDAMLNDPEVNDPWAKAVTKLAHNSTGRTPFQITGSIVGAVEMVHVSPVAPYFVVPLEIDGEAALAMITTGSGEVVLDSSTRPEPSWVSSLRFDHLEIHDVPALAQDLSGISKELGAPIKAVLGVNLLRHLNATFDYRGHQFVTRSFAPPPPPAATRLDLHYARGGAIVVNSAIGGEKGPHAALLVDTSRPFFVALDEGGWKKAGKDVTQLKPIAADPEQKLKEDTISLNLGAFPIRNVEALYGVQFTDLEKATQVDLDGLIGAGLLYPYRCTFSDEGRVLWIEDDLALERMVAPPQGPAQPAAPPAGGLAAPPGPTAPTLLPPGAGPVNERDVLPGPSKAPPPPPSRK